VSPPVPSVLVRLDNSRSGNERFASLKSNHTATLRQSPTDQSGDYLVAPSSHYSQSNHRFDYFALAQEVDCFSVDTAWWVISTCCRCQSTVQVAH
jgi:hypothetical protein